jgi:hypothetical protein
MECQIILNLDFDSRLQTRLEYRVRKNNFDKIKMIITVILNLI